MRLDPFERPRARSAAHVTILCSAASFVLTLAGCGAPPRQHDASVAPTDDRATNSPVSTLASSSPTASRPPRQDPADALQSMLDVTVPPQYRCAVVVDAVERDENLRGSPRTDISSEMDMAESHGESYRKCTYRVTVKDKRWRYVATWDTTFARLPESWCEDARAHVAAKIQRTTGGCTNLQRYGSDLTPLDRKRR